MNKISTWCVAAVVGAFVGAACLWLGMWLAAPSTVVVALPSPPAVERLSAPPSFPKRLSPDLPVVSAVPETDRTPLFVRIENTSTKAAVGGVFQPAPPPIALGPTSSRQLLSDPVHRRRSGMIDSALSYALETADPSVKEGFSIREDYWGGDLPLKEARAIIHQLFKGNEYWFWMGVDPVQAECSVHVYDAEGQIIDAEAWRQRNSAVVRVVPPKTGAYYVVVQIDKSPDERTVWALTYGFR